MTKGCFNGVLIASGHLWSLHIPAIPGEFTGHQVQSGHYMNTKSLYGERVLVVGAGNSGCDIAVDVAQRRLEADIVIRQGRHFQPKTYFGVPRAQVPFLSQHSPDEQDLINRLLARLSIGENTAYPGRRGP